MGSGNTDTPTSAGREATCSGYCQKRSAAPSNTANRRNHVLALLPNSDSSPWKVRNPSVVAGALTADVANCIHSMWMAGNASRSCMRSAT